MKRQDSPSIQLRSQAAEKQKESKKKPNTMVPKKSRNVRKLVTEKLQHLMMYEGSQMLENNILKMVKIEKMVQTKIEVETDDD